MRGSGDPQGLWRTSGPGSGPAPLDVPLQAQHGALATGACCPPPTGRPGATHPRHPGGPSRGTSPASVTSDRQCQSPSGTPSVRGDSGRGECCGPAGQALWRGRGTLGREQPGRECADWPHGVGPPGEAQGPEDTGKGKRGRSGRPEGSGCRADERDAQGQLEGGRAPAEPAHLWAWARRKGTPALFHSALSF